jgi:hypothetical protein
MSDPVTALAAQVASALGPYLPSLLDVGQHAANQAAAAMGERAWDLATDLWDRLKPAVEARPTALETAHDVAAHADDEDARAALRLQLKKLLADDAGLRQDLERLLREAERHGVTTVSITGDRNIAVTGNIDRGTLITGDDNRTGR